MILSKSTIKITIFSVLTVFFGSNVRAQCPQFLTISGQSDVDSFMLQFPNCTRLNGTLTIRQNNSTDTIKNLQGLSNLKYIGGLRIERTRRLINLEGLNFLDTIDGSLSIKYNSTLSDITALRSVKNINGGLDIEGNSKLKSLDGLNGVKQLTSLRLYKTSLVNLHGLDSLESIGDNHMTIFDNDNLLSLDGLQSLKRIGGSTFTGKICRFEFNSNLQSVDALSNLETFNLNLFIEFNHGLTSLEGLENISFFNGSLRLIENRSLISLDAIKDWKMGGFELFIWDNPALETCHVESICDYLEGSEFRSILGNKGSCRNEEAIIEACESIISSANWLNNQDEIKLYPNPITDFLGIKLQNSLKGEIAIYNMQGQKLYDTIIGDSNFIEIHDMNLNPGIYLLIIGKMYKKFIVKKI